jgi:serine/threonine-protein kinase
MAAEDRSVEPEERDSAHAADAATQAAPAGRAPTAPHADHAAAAAPHPAAQPPIATQKQPLELPAAEAPPLYAAQTTPALGAVPARTGAEAETALAHDAWIGRVLDGRYRVTERLGEGGMGAVFVAEHLKLRKPVALKVIRKELAGNGEVAARFGREAMATAQFEHPHVASAIDFGTLEEGGAYLVMQLVRGESLRAMLDRRGALPWPLACELLAQVADALSAARGAGIVHRDLKPENILVDTRDDGSYLAKILDFGIAHVIQPSTGATDGNSNQRALTRVGTVMGTPGYMSPEQAVGDRVDHRTDLYALGVVLWECLTGKPLWDGPDVTTIITKQLSERVPAPREVLGDPLFPRTLDNLVVRLCARSPEERPEHAGLVRDELRSVARQPMTPAFAIAEHASLTYRAARERFVRWPRSSQLLLLAGSVALLAAVIFGVSHRRAEPEPEPVTAVREPGPVLPEPVASKKRGEETAVSVTKTQDKPTLAERARDFAERIVNDTPLIKPEVKPVIPRELEPDVKLMLESNRSSERRRAALKVLRYKGPSKLPAHVVSIARLERARTCRERQDAIAELEDLGDARVLGALRRIADAPRTGCGFLGLSDCYGCVRGDVRDAISKLGK